MIKTNLQPAQTFSRRSFLKTAAVSAMAAVPCFRPESSEAAEGRVASSSAPVKVAVLTGGHLFDVPAFHRLFRSWPEVDAYIQHMTDFAGAPPNVRDSYDVVLFYTMLRDALQQENLNPQLTRTKDAIERLRASGQGIVVLHHAILSYPDWNLWTELTGLADRKFTFHYNQQVKVQVAAQDHPVTRGLKSWDMVDETYNMTDAGDGSRILLTTEHPKSMKTLGWTREFGKSRVFCLQSGHDDESWSNPNFKEVLRRGICWSAKVGVGS